jgi:Esterase-like activity of phytase
VGSAASLRFDPEGVRVSPAGTFFVSDEYGPYVYEFNAAGGRLRVLPMPAKFLIDHPNAVGTNELPPGNNKGRQANRGMEGLALSPDGSKLYGIMQNALIQDGALNMSNSRRGLHNRILEIDVATGHAREFVYVLTDRSNGVNEILAVNDHEFLVLERDGNAGASAAFKKIFKIDLAGATDVSGVANLPQTGPLPSGITPVSKAPFLDLLDPAFGLAGAAFPEKIEGLAFGPNLPDGRHLLLVTSDNDFFANQDSKIFAFATPPETLPGFKPQVLPAATFGHFSGKATGLGRGARTEIAMVTAFQLERTLDLDAATAVTITHLLGDGVRDVMGLPLTLQAECCNNASTAYFKTAVGAGPIARVTIGARGGNEFTLRIEVTQATSEPSDQCPHATLITALLIHDGGDSPVSVATQQPWLCFGTGNQYLRSPQ